MIVATNRQAGLTDALRTSVISNAANLISDFIFGPLATAIAVIAIASVGLAMLSGRVDIRRGLSVLFGCFLIFGARGIADGLRSSAISESQQSISAVSPPPNYPMPPPTSANNANAFDPYAGAEVMRPGT
jgi:type IV secretory pathway VirB2 component (pilin)